MQGNFLENNYIKAGGIPIPTPEYGQYRRVGRSHHHHHHRLYLGQAALLVCMEKSHAILVGVAGSATVNQPLHTSNNIAGLVVDLGDLRPETLPQSKPLVELLLQRKS